jgi:phage terminase small subunit
MRPAKPTALKIIQGNPGKRPLNRHEPKPAPRCARPKFLNGRAARIWDEYAPELERIGVLTAVDGHLFAAWCTLAAELEIQAGRMSAPRIAQMRMLAAAFGLEPSSRARLVVKSDETAEHPAARYLVI